MNEINSFGLPFVRSSLCRGCPLVVCRCVWCSLNLSACKVRLFSRDNVQRSCAPIARPRFASKPLPLFRGALLALVSQPHLSRFKDSQGTGHLELYATREADPTSNEVIRRDRCLQVSTLVALLYARTMPKLTRAASKGSSASTRDHSTEGEFNDVSSSSNEPSQT